MNDYSLETKCIHSGYTPSKGEPCALPICQSTTYKYDTTDEMGQLFDLKADADLSYLEDFEAEACFLLENPPQDPDSVLSEAGDSPVLPALSYQIYNVSDAWL